MSDATRARALPTAAAVAGAGPLSNSSCSFFSFRLTSARLRVTSVVNDATSGSTACWKTTGTVEDEEEEEEDAPAEENTVEASPSSSMALSDFFLALSFLPPFPDAWDSASSEAIPPLIPAKLATTVSCAVPSAAGGCQWLKNSAHTRQQHARQHCAVDSICRPLLTHSPGWLFSCASLSSSAFCSRSSKRATLERISSAWSTGVPESILHVCCCGRCIRTPPSGSCGERTGRGMMGRGRTRRGETRRGELSV